MWKTKTTTATKHWKKENAKFKNQPKSKCHRILERKILIMNMVFLGESRKRIEFIGNTLNFLTCFSFGLVCHRYHYRLTVKLSLLCNHRNHCKKNVFSSWLLLLSMIFHISKPKNYQGNYREVIKLKENKTFFSVPNDNLESKKKNLKLWNYQLVRENYNIAIEQYPGKKISQNIFRMVMHEMIK